MQSKQKHSKLIEKFVVVGLTPAMNLLNTQETDYITSLSINQKQKVDPKYQKLCDLADGNVLCIAYNEKDIEPITEIGIFSIPPAGWIKVQIPIEYNIFEEFICYRTTSDRIHDSTLKDISLIKYGAVCSFWSQKQKEFKNSIKIPYTQDCLVLHMNSSRKSHILDIELEERKYSANIIEKYPENEKQIYLSQISSFCFPKGISLSYFQTPYIIFNFILTQQNGDRLYCTCLKFMQKIQKQLSLLIKIQKQVYAQKGYIIVSRYCYTDQFLESIENLYLYSIYHQQCSISTISKNFVDLLKLPQDVGMGVQNKIGYKIILFETCAQYPIISERALSCLFKLLEVDNIISIFKYILLEKKIFFISSSKTILGLVTQAFLSLLFPFKWQHILIPVVPYNLVQYLQSPIPTIAGLEPDMVNQSLGYQVLVYLDHNNIAIFDKQLSNMKPFHYQKIFKKNLLKYELYSKNFIYQFLQCHQNPSFFKPRIYQFQKFKIHQIRNEFMSFIQSLMQNYQDFLIQKQQLESTDRKNGSIQTRSSKQRSPFDIKQFRKMRKINNKQSFIYQFTETGIFTTFIQRKYQNPQHPQILFFDRSLINQSQQITQIKNQKYIPISCFNPHDLSFENKINQIELKNNDDTLTLEKDFIIISQNSNIVEKSLIYEIHDLLEPQVQQICSQMVSPLKKKNKSNQNNNEYTQNNSALIALLQQERIFSSRNSTINQMDQSLFGPIQQSIYDKTNLAEPLLQSQIRIQDKKKLGEKICNVFDCIYQSVQNTSSNFYQWICKQFEKKKNINQQKSQKEINDN